MELLVIQIVFKPGCTVSFSRELLKILAWPHLRPAETQPLEL
jgi:hypothetical protein